MTNPRFELRSRVIFRVSLPPLSRLLYLALDDMARDRGSWFIKQSELALRLGVSRRQLQRSLEELETAGLISSDRTGRSSVYRMGWLVEKPADASPMAYQMRAGVVSDASPMAHRSIYTASTETGTEQAAGEWVAEALATYPGAASLPGDPPAEVVASCLALCRGDVERLRPALEDLWKRRQRRPGRSWGWFPIVLADYFKAERTA